MLLHQVCARHVGVQVSDREAAKRMLLHRLDRKLWQ